MRWNILTLALVAILAAVGPARELEDRREDAWRRRERFERRLREADERRREAVRDYYEDLREDRRRFGDGPVDPAWREYRRGYRGYVPVGPLVPGYGEPAWSPEVQPFDPVPLPGVAPQFVEPPPVVEATSLAAEVDALIEQSDAFIRVFSQTGAEVPEAGRQLATAQALNESARTFRQLLSAGADPGQLAGALRAIEDHWGRMSWRTERLARGRTGPNIEQVRLMGRTIERIRQAFPF